MAQRGAALAPGRAREDLTDVDIVEVEARPGDRLLLCSDGLTDLVADERIAEVLRLKDPHSAAAVLTHTAPRVGAWTTSPPW